MLAQRVIAAFRTKAQAILGEQLIGINGHAYDRHAPHPGLNESVREAFMSTRIDKEMRTLKETVDCRLRLLAEKLEIWQFINLPL